MASQELQQVYLLWHTHELEDGETEDKLLGVKKRPRDGWHLLESFLASGKLPLVSRWLDTWLTATSGPKVS
jgi:hypothetical protein